MSNNNNKITLQKLTIASIFMAINVVFSSFGIPIPGGRIYLCDAVICTAAMLFDPLFALAIGGVGSLIGDFFFYPAAMFVSFVVHGLQAFAVSVCVKYTFKRHNLLSMILGGIVGTVIMTVGYTIGKVFVYGAYGEWIPAILTAPFEFLQSSVGTIIAILLCHTFKLKEKLKIDF